jgi:hypothetical protein
MNKKRKQEHCVREKKRIKMDLRRFVYIWENEPENAIYNRYSLHARAARNPSALKPKILKNIQTPIRLRPLSSGLKVNMEELQNIIKPGSYEL